MGAARLHYSGLTDVGLRIREGDLSPVELVEILISRIEELEPRLHSYATLMAEHARSAARRAEAEIRAGRYRGPLHGVPVAVKDLCFTKGVATRGGTGALADHAPDHDATVVARLERAGAVLLGKLNTTEGAMAGYHPDFGVPRNPWGEDLWPGVSSSGSGVATAAGLCYASLGTDTGGSIRYPSAMNGIVGLKPTWGRVSRFGVLDLAPSLDHVGPMTRRVSDAAAVLHAIAGADPRDPTALPDRVPDYLAGIAEGIEGVRLGFDEDYATRGLPEHYAESIREAVSTLERLGAKVVAVMMPTMDAPHLDAWQSICAAEAASVHEATFPSKAASYGPWFRTWLRLGASVTGIQYAKAHALRRQLEGAVRTAFVGIDLLACPSVLSEPFVYDRDGVFQPPNLEAGTSAGVPLSWFNGSRPFILPYDYNGYPTLSLPCGASPAGLPLSLQLVGHPLGEHLLCRVGHTFEQATEWHRWHPPI